ncbi:unnamed protein product [Spirodela intermedia]|uniref:Uncharacterized protein n=1 Tax=Spirodela intermedia TaxID=51605 RepID=A0A7I8KAV6_SPIIN|nr:unnamed protein product [Spirodela intermedia]
MGSPEIHSGASTRLKSLLTSFARPKSATLGTNSPLLERSEQNPRRRTRLTCWIVPMVLTSVRNCFSPCLIPSSFLTATTLPSAIVPKNTDPNPPPPSFSEKFFVIRRRSPYQKATRPPSATRSALNRRLRRRLHSSANKVTIRAPTATAAPTAAPTIFPSPDFEPVNSEAARRRKSLPPWSPSCRRLASPPYQTEHPPSKA